MSPAKSDETSVPYQPENRHNSPETSSRLSDVVSREEKKDGYCSVR